MEAFVLTIMLYARMTNYDVYYLADVKFQDFSSLEACEDEKRKMLEAHRALLAGNKVPGPVVFCASKSKR
jgi:hypothetical protein